MQIIMLAGTIMGSILLENHSSFADHIALAF